MERERAHERGRKAKRKKIKGKQFKRELEKVKRKKGG